MTDRLEKAIDILRRENLSIEENEFHGLQYLSASLIESYWRNQKIIRRYGTRYAGSFSDFMKCVNRTEDISRKEVVITGSIIDKLISGEGYMERYAVQSFNTPSEGIGKRLADEFVTKLIASDEKMNYANTSQFLSSKNEYYLNKSIEKRTDGFIKDYGEYINFSVENSTKIPIRRELLDNCIEIFNTVSDNKKFQKYSENCINQLQLLRTFDINGEKITVKGMIDRLYIDEDKNKILLIDHKFTTVNPEDWEQHSINMQYSIQSSMYWNIVYDILSDYGLEDLLENKFLFFVIFPNGNVLEFEDYGCNSTTTSLLNKSNRRCFDDINDLNYYLKERPEYPKWLNVYQPNELLWV